MFLTDIGESLLESCASVFEHGLVGLVVARAGDEAKYFGIFERAPEDHFLDSNNSTSLPLPKENPLL
jgi:hypothetical protein